MEEIDYFIDKLRQNLHTRPLRPIVNNINTALERVNMKPAVYDFQFSSQSGAYPYAYRLSDYESLSQWDAPKYDLKTAFQDRTCNVDVLEGFCFGKALEEPYDGFNETDNMLLRIAKQHPACGDCLLTLLSTTSTSKGLQDYLPPRNHPRRHDVVSLLHRYSYTIGTMAGRFVMATSPTTASQQFSYIVKGRPSQICINDDIETRSTVVSEMFTELMHAFLAGMFPWKSLVEQDDFVGDPSDSAIGIQFWNQNDQKNAIRRNMVIKQPPRKIIGITDEVSV